MINLLPSDLKQEISYARRNTTLRKWIIASSIALLGVLLIVASGLLYIRQAMNSYTKQVETNRQTLQTQKVTETQKRLDEISDNTKLTVQVLSREILFSKLIRQIGAALPANSELKKLEIDKVQGGVQLDATATDFNSATQIQLNLQDPKNKVFDKADINSIDCKSGECDVVLRALFGKNNQYLYIAPNAPASGAKP